MLALSRKKNEAIVINNDIEITVLEVKGDQVKIGITAPKEVPIYRKEVYLQIQEANKAAVDAEGMAEPVGVKQNKIRKRKRLWMHKSGAFIHC